MLKKSLYFMRRAILYGKDAAISNMFANLNAYPI